MRKIGIIAICLCLALALLTFAACDAIEGGSSSGGSSGPGNHEHQFRETAVAQGESGHVVKNVCSICGYTEDIPGKTLEAHSLKKVTTNGDPYVGIDGEGNAYMANTAFAKETCEICGYSSGGTTVYYGEEVTGKPAEELILAAANSFSSVNKYTHNHYGDKTTYYKVGNYWYNKWGTLQRPYAIEKFVQVLKDAQGNLDDYMLCKAVAMRYQTEPMEGTYYVLWHRVSNGVSDYVCIIDADFCVKAINHDEYFSTVDLSAEVPGLQSSIDSYTASTEEMRANAMEEIDILLDYYDKITVWNKSESSGEAVGTKYEWTALSEDVVKLETDAEGTENDKTEYLAKVNGRWYLLEDGGTPAIAESEDELLLRLPDFSAFSTWFASHYTYFKGYASKLLYYELGRYYDGALYGSRSNCYLSVAKLDPASDISYNVKWTRADADADARSAESAGIIEQVENYLAGPETMNSVLVGKTFVFSDFDDHEIENYESAVAATSGNYYYFDENDRVRYVMRNVSTTFGGYYELLTDGTITIRLRGVYYNGQYIDNGDNGTFTGTCAEGVLTLTYPDVEVKGIWLLSE